MDGAQSQSAVIVLFNNFWVLLFLALILFPMIQKGVIQRERRRVLARLGKKRSSQVIALIHRQEVISLLGIPIARYIDIDDSEEVLRARYRD